MAKVIAPNKHYTGISANVVFRDGVGETSDPHLISWFRSKGYMVKLAAEVVQVPPEVKQAEPERVEKPAKEKKPASKPKKSTTKKPKGKEE